MAINTWTGCCGEPHPEESAKFCAEGMELLKKRNEVQETTQE